VQYLLVVWEEQLGNYADGDQILIDMFTEAAETTSLPVAAL